MKIVRLKSENVMRLVAVDITPEGNLITIGGKNGAGKSSVLNAIAMALGGAALVPTEPIRQGQSSGRVDVDLGDMLVTRTFSRTKLENGTWGPTESRLSVTNTHGAPYPSPQALLNKLLGKLTFDPLAFAMADEKPQYEMLRSLVGIDTSAIEQRRQNAYATRAVLNKSHDIKSSQLIKLATHKDVPAQEISLDEVNADIQQAQLKRNASIQADNDHTAAIRALDARNGDRRLAAQQLALLEEQVVRLRETLTKIDESLVTLNNEAQQTEERKKLAYSEVPDMSLLQQKLTHIQTVNAKVRDNLEYAKASAEVDRLGAEAKEQDQIVKACEEQKVKTLASVTFPVEGLGLTESLTESGVTFQGVPFKQASTSEQIRVSVAIGLALNPKLKVLLIRNGNALDDESLKAVAAQAEAANAQLWMEYVTKNAQEAAEVSVLIEDGQTHAEPPKPQPVTTAPDVDVPFQLG